eukprot:1670528-Pyramimonas_sp.AAC.1
MFVFSGYDVARPAQVSPQDPLLQRALCLPTSKRGHRPDARRPPEPLSHAARAVQVSPQGRLRQR